MNIDYSKFKFTEYNGDCNFCEQEHILLIRLLHYDNTVFICENCLKQALKSINKSNKTKSHIRKESIRELDLK